MSGYLTEDGAFRFHNRSFDAAAAHTSGLLRVMAVEPSGFCGGSDTKTMKAVLF